MKQTRKEGNNKPAVRLSDLSGLVKPFSSVRLYFGKGHPSNAKYHIRAIVDGSQVVFREWSYCKQRWNYRVEHIYLFQIYHHDGILKKA